MSNRLINESSPYLLQHANNPVDWYPWSDEAFERAKAEGKLVLVSIGYSSCHWCHVMEHESFEDSEVATLMNTHYICIKVDREERPDVDQRYMDAVQLISGRGGWPLNCFALPDGRPVFGGTYFPKEQWKSVLVNLAEGFKHEPARFEEAAASIENGMAEMAKQLLPDISESSKDGDSSLQKNYPLIKSIITRMEASFDNVNGGSSHVPKFPMPSIYEFLLNYVHWSKSRKKEQELAGLEKITDHIYLTLDKMAMGGIYDQVGGGFSRYSTDGLWKAPHFEKMLYDNGQLMSLYSHAWQCRQVDLYKGTVYGVHNFISANLTSLDGGFYSALDADSEGREGEYYVWTKDELQQIIGDESDLFSDYFTVRDNEKWESGKFILWRKISDADFCKKHNLSPADFANNKAGWINKLNDVRQKRIAPALDDKILASWNGIMLKGYVDAYNAFGDEVFLQTAIKNAIFIRDNLVATDGSMQRTYKNGKAKISAFLDDYALVADAIFSLYQCTFDESWLKLSQKIVSYAIGHFYDKASGLFFYSEDVSGGFITRKIETSDNVIPSSNSVMADLLFGLGHALCSDEYIKMVSGMLAIMSKNISAYPQGYSNWARLLLSITGPFYEVAITGKDACRFNKEINARYLPNKIVAGAEKVSDMELLKDKFAHNKTLIYVCENKTCRAPVSSSGEALRSILAHG